MLLKFSKKSAQKWLIFTKAHFERSLFLFILCLLSSCEVKLKKDETPVQVEIFKVEPKTIPINYEFVGVTASSHPVEIRARLEGYLLKIAYTEGSFVQKGDLLFVIDPKPFEVTVNEAKANLAQQMAFLDNANINVSRLTTLYGQDAVSKKSLDDAIAEKNQAEARIEIAQTKLQQAELNLSYTKITSPISGLTGAANFREGTLINPASNSLLTTVSVIDPIWVNFSISESEILKAKKDIIEKKLDYPTNFDVMVKLSDGSDFPFTGKVSFASPTLDPKTGTLNVRAIFPNPKYELIPGLFVRAEVIGAQRNNAIYVPQKAIQQSSQGSFVYIVDEESRVRIRQVELGNWYENYWIVESGLNKGDRVITEGVNKVHEGTEVEII